MTHKGFRAIRVGQDVHAHLIDDGGQKITALVRRGSVVTLYYDKTNRRGWEPFPETADDLKQAGIKFSEARETYAPLGFTGGSWSELDEWIKEQ